MRLFPHPTGYPRKVGVALHPISLFFVARFGHHDRAPMHDPLPFHFLFSASVSDHLFSRPSFSHHTVSPSLPSSTRVPQARNSIRRAARSKAISWLSTQQKIKKAYSYISDTPERKHAAHPLPPLSFSLPPLTYSTLSHHPRLRSSPIRPLSTAQSPRTRDRSRLDRPLACSFVCGGGLRHPTPRSSWLSRRVKRGPMWTEG